MHFFAHLGHDHSEMIAEQKTPDPTTGVILIVPAAIVIAVLVAIVIIAKKSKTKPANKT